MNTPTDIKELEAARQKLIDDIEGAEKLFGTEAKSSAELLTVKIGLRLIEEKLADLRSRN
jgi:hypothetical protein